VLKLWRDFYVLLITFFISVLGQSQLPEPLLPTNRNALHPVVEKNRTHIALKRTGRRRRVAALGEVPARYDPVRAAFYVSWDPTSLAALQQHFHDIDLLIPERLHSITAEGRSMSNRSEIGGVAAIAAAATPPSKFHDCRAQQF